ncbi:MAG TPA: hypothetical protein VHF51_11030 [Solirubrobacteraceae bacterium]|nr:hypothetical protein [Solirubrobacteraceae bacterium]
MSGRRRPAPPSGQPPPRAATLADGTALDLEALAAEICARYRAEYPDEEEHYGEAGHLWCLHDNQHLLNWAALHTQRYVALDSQVAWLARVLEAREFPLDRLARDLDIAADVVRARVPAGAAVAEALSGAAAMVRSRPTFL